MSELEKILWNYLMDCLKIHHMQEDREIKTIPEAQKIYASALKSEFMKAIGEDRGCLCKDYHIDVSSGKEICVHCNKEKSMENRGYNQRGLEIRQKIKEM